MTVMMATDDDAHDQSCIEPAKRLVLHQRKRRVYFIYFTCTVRHFSKIFEKILKVIK